jgi:hypothetical protein
VKKIENVRGQSHENQKRETDKDGEEKIADTGTLQSDPDDNNRIPAAYRVSSRVHSYQKVKLLRTASRFAFY